MTQLEYEIRKAANAQAKIKQLEAFAEALVKVIIELQTRVDVLSATIADHNEEIINLHQRVTQVNQQPKIKPEFVSSQMMAKLADVTGNSEKIAVLRHFARQYCEKNQLKVHKGEGRAAQEHFPSAAAEWAIAQLKGES